MYRSLSLEDLFALIYFYLYLVSNLRYFSRDMDIDSRQHCPLEEDKSYTQKVTNPLSFFRQRIKYGNRYGLVCEAERSGEENQSRRDAREGCSVTDGQREAPPDSDGSLPECNAYVTTANNSRNNTTAVCCALLSSRNTYTALGK